MRWTFGTQDKGALAKFEGHKNIFNSLLNFASND